MTCARLALPFTCCLVLAPVTAFSETRFEMADDPVVTSFGLYYDRYETDLDIEGTDVETRVERLGITFTEQLSRQIHGRIDLGYLATFQDDNPVTGNNDQTGQYLALGLGARLPLTQRISLGGDVGYSFNYADGEINDVETDISWREADARAYVDFRVPAARFRVGGHAQDIDGEFDIDSTPSQSLVFEGSENTGLFAGVDLYVDRGRVSLYGHTGDRSGFSFAFAVDY